MPGTVWGKFYWSDWSNDPALRVCSLASQGLWMRMLCTAAEADPIGYVTVNGRTLDGQDLARLTGVSVPEVETLLAELDRNGVFSRDRKGTIYSRRMVRDAKHTKSSAKGGKIGGAVTRDKQKGIFATQGPTQEGTQHPDTRSQKKKKKKKEGSVANATAPPDEWSEHDDRRLLFGGALQWLVKKTNRSVASCRSNIGHWLKLTGDDATAILAIMRRARDFDAAEPIAWIEAALKPKANGHTPPEADWPARGRFFHKTGRWLDEWGERSDVPQEFASLFTVPESEASGVPH